MTKKVISGTPEMEIEEVATMFSKNNIKKLPITKEGKLVGIITQTDLLKIMSLNWAL